MIRIVTIPVADPVATTQDLLIEIVERTCRSYHINDLTKPSATTVFNVEKTQVLGGTTIATISAVITITTPRNNGCGCADVQVYTETFDVAFDSIGTVTLEVSTNSSVDPAYIKCCRSRGVKYVTTLSATIA